MTSAKLAGDPTGASARLVLGGQWSPYQTENEFHHSLVYRELLVQEQVDYQKHVHSKLFEKEQQEDQSLEQNRQKQERLEKARMQQDQRDQNSPACAYTQYKINRPAKRVETLKKMLAEQKRIFLPRQDGSVPQFKMKQKTKS
ncbi:MAG: hypothetical protein SGBAC_010689 [Bacillariaceae sp.]